MKKLMITALSALVFSAAFAGKGIIVEQKFTGSTALGTSITITWYVTDNACKMKMTFSDGTTKTVSDFIPDPKGSQLLLYNEAGAPSTGVKTYFVTPLSSIKPPANVDATGLKVNRTGETQNINGVKCEKVIVNTTTTETEMWVTTDFKCNFYQFASYFRNSYELLGLSAEKMKGFPVKSVTKSLDGTVLSNYDATSVSQTDLADTEFQVPAEYVKAAR